MQVYFRYELDDDGRICRRLEIEAMDDDAALAACRETEGAPRFEVWLGSRLVYSPETEVIAAPSGDRPAKLPPGRAARKQCVDIEARCGPSILIMPEPSPASERVPI